MDSGKNRFFENHRLPHYYNQLNILCNHALGCIACPKAEQTFLAKSTYIWVLNVKRTIAKHICDLVTWSDNTRKYPSSVSLLQCQSWLLQRKQSSLVILFSYHCPQRDAGYFSVIHDVLDSGQEKSASNNQKLNIKHKLRRAGCNRRWKITFTHTVAKILSSKKHSRELRDKRRL